MPRKKKSNPEFVGVTFTIVAHLGVGHYQFGFQICEFFRGSGFSISLFSMGSHFKDLQKLGMYCLPLPKHILKAAVLSGCLSCLL